MGINNKALTTQIKEKENKFSFINPGDSNTLQQRKTQEVKVKARKKEKVASLIRIFYTQSIIQLIYWIRKWNST